MTDNLWLLQSAEMTVNGEFIPLRTWYKGIDKDFTAVKELAIHSLEAWQKVREDIEFERDRKLGGEAFEAVQYKSFQKCLDIIDRYLKEV